MATYDADLQAAVDSTSVAYATGQTELLDYLRGELAQRDIETSDEDWLHRMVEGIKADRGFMIDSEPSDYERPRRDT
ncbi:MULTISPECIES: hypothetical protein [Nocardioides]|uniref:Uncharacterized protein n=1 Tax=Nocardioides kribbensis TaxID=305517 RepID=A0ABV1NZ67_9ACTN|nr:MULTISPECIES: hypothetical protein [Nocardioides]KQP64730.1 hypothetical protein ASF47_12525 [Nocardioides sp. Leaf285]KQQ43743.1 hypothetical protein ASF50_07570 [Nocardioides sp. Leaf307]MBJ7529779.1 hypothetical protein [Nocardioides sp.]MCM3515479.1 hypothetical protein [Nocardioides sp. P86]